MDFVLIGAGLSQFFSAKLRTGTALIIAPKSEGGKPLTPYPMLEENISMRTMQNGRIIAFAPRIDGCPATLDTG